MSRIEELIREKCPDGVLYKSIESLVSYKRGKGLSKDDKGTGDNPIILYGELYTTYGDYIDRIVSFASDEVILSSVKIRKGDVVLPISSTTKEAKIGKASVLRCDNACLGGDAVAFTPKSEIMSEFLMYVINSGLFEMDKMKCVKGVTIRHLDTSKMMLIAIPVPPIEVQQEIVRILDKFTELEAELQTELDARKKQYEYYLNNCLAYRDNTPFVKLCNLCEIKGRIGFRGYTHDDFVQKGEGAISLSPGNIDNNHIVYGDCKYITWEKYDESPEIMLDIDDVVVCKTGSTVGKVAVVNYLPEKATLNPQLVVLKKIKCNHKYLFYQLSASSIQRRIKGLAGVGSVPNISQKSLGDIEIAVLSIEEQDKIVTTLDAFDAICNGHETGLPAEIAARHKQYEYYRDKLLTFKRKEV